MNVLLHTIALEPARWIPQKVHRPLSELLPAIAAAGFGPLEVFEPHLSTAPDEVGLGLQMNEYGLTPVVLSSYLDLSPATNPGPSFLSAADALLARVDRFAFRKVRLFPGRSPTAEQDAETLQGVASRLRDLAGARPSVEFLVETHDHSLADNPANMVRLMERCGRENVGLVWQPTIFEPGPARAQFSVQGSHVRHFHLQNRDQQGKFVLLGQGIVPWQEFLQAATGTVDATLEFVPCGICEPAGFDLAATIAQAVDERRWAAEAVAAKRLVV